MRLDVDLHAAEVTGTEDLDRLTAPDGAGVSQRARVDLPALHDCRAGRLLTSQD